MNDLAQADGRHDYITFGGLLKASPREEGGKRYLYFEATTEGNPDYENEVVLQKALSESSGYFLRHGNIDLDHYSIIGARQGIADYLSYEIGRPEQVSMSGKSTFVKALLYRGSSAMAQKANTVWDSITKQNPPARWYPSIGGTVLGASKRVDPLTKSEVRFIEKVRWNNIALTRTPVHRDVPEVSTAPIGGLSKAEFSEAYFLKSLGGFVTKALTTGYGTDSATLAGGAALREQSLAGVSNYLEFRERLAKNLRAGEVGANPGAREMVQHCTKQGMTTAKACEYVERFMKDINQRKK